MYNSTSAIYYDVDMLQKSDHGSSVEEHINKSSTILPQSSADRVESIDDAAKIIQREGADACKVDAELHDHKY
ncbi:unnamed protein product [Adineta steineri]|uniref:Uncharacterized protein n=1 Tax=Adineta steineri TaxID=433720 RepID=A0A818Z0F5_9BILA|nr:unnamed protein product [Adineta steineri]CAF3757069.1 unnamed protein product [Adineta steineri]